MLVNERITNLVWLSRLRWLAAVGQIVTILFARFVLEISFQTAPLWPFVGLTVLSNLALGIYLRREPKVAAPPEALFFGIFALDAITLTGLLAFTGGPANPFSVLFLVHVALAAVSFRRHITWSFAALSSLCFLFLFTTVCFLGCNITITGLEGFSLHLKGMWIAFAISAGLIAYLVQGILAELRKKDVALEEFRRREVKQERLVAMATLTAGLAHELSTPLSTIAVIAKELEEEFEGDAQEDLALIRDQVARCRSIVDRLRTGSGAKGDVPVSEPVSLFALEEDLRRIFPQEARLQFSWHDRLASVHVYREYLTTILINFIRNALDVSGEKDGVVVRSHEDQDNVWFEVSDSGGGLSGQVERRVFEPFFTTKEPGQGMGLGLYLSHALAEKMGGEIRLENRANGTTARLSLPAPTGSSAVLNERLLVVDDDAVFRERLAKAFRRRGFEVTTAPDADAAMRLAKNHAFSRATIDLRLPGGGRADGLALVAALKNLQPDLEIVMLTGYGSIVTAVEAMRLGAKNYVTKPADCEQILAAFEGQSVGREERERTHQVPSLADIEWEHIQTVLRACDGNISEAARQLGMHRRSLQRKLLKYPNP